MSALLPVQRADTLLARAPDQQWLVENLWAAEAVGIIGGEPKCGKSFLALDLAVSVASAQPCLGHFRPVTTGRVLLYAAEDALHVGASGWRESAPPHRSTSPPSICS